MDKDTISVVPLTGLLKTTRPMTSATTKKQSKKARMAATTRSILVICSLNFWIFCMLAYSVEA
jgi:hypothetical protein